MAWKSDVPHLDVAAAALAERQYGVVSRRQLLGLGFTANMIDRRLRTRRLLRLHRGVYALGHRRLQRGGHWMAAVLAAGDGALLSHRDAAALHGLRRPHDGIATDVTTTGRARRTPALAVHQAVALAAEDRATVDRIPVTSVARTLVDLAGVVGKQALAAALNEAERADVLDVGAIERVLERTRGRRGRGHANLRAVLREHRDLGPTLTRSELERAFLDLLEASDLPRPRTNVRRLGHEVDMCWPAARLIVELDGWQYHRTRAQFESDRARDAELEAAGWRVIRVTARQLKTRRATLVRNLRALLR
jgi:very-short-patch-repair endonuclease